MTTHVTYAGQPRLAAFINKGKAYPKVTAKEVSHQIVRVQQLHHLGLIVGKCPETLPEFALCASSLP